MRRIGAILMTAAVLLAGIVGASAQAEGDQAADTPSETTETFGAWTVHCRSGSGSKACEVVHAIQAQGGMLARIAIGVPPGEEAKVVVVLTPLGVDLAAPVRLGVEGGDTPVSLPFATCLQNGCIAQAGIDATGLDALAAAERGVLSFAERTGRAIQVAVPLAGLRAALARL